MDNETAEEPIRLSCLLNSTARCAALSVEQYSKMCRTAVEQYSKMCRTVNIVPTVPSAIKPAVLNPNFLSTTQHNRNTN
jgi:hypothetical protein